MNDGGQILWIVTADCAMFKVSCQMRKLMRTIIWRTVSAGQLYLTHQRLNIIQYPRKIRRGSTSATGKCPQTFFRAILLGRCETGKETYSLQTLRNYKTMQLEKSILNGPNSKEVIVQKERDVFVFHCADFSKNWKEEVARSKHSTNFGKIPKWNRTLI